MHRLHQQVTHIHRTNFSSYLQIFFLVLCIFKNDGQYTGYKHRGQWNSWVTTPLYRTSRSRKECCSSSETFCAPITTSKNIILLHRFVGVESRDRFTSTLTFETVLHFACFVLYINGTVWHDLSHIVIFPITSDFVNLSVFLYITASIR